MERVDYADGERTLVGQLYRPKGTTRAAVAVFPTIMNLTPAVGAKAQALADVGYLAFVCDFYGQAPADFTHAQELANALRKDTPAYRARLRAGLVAMAVHAPDLPRAAIGVCMGGQAALEMARDGTDLVLVTSFHGLLDTALPAEPGAVKSRILVCHGDADILVPRSQVTAFWEEMDRAGANWHFHSYSGVKHGFTNPDADRFGKEFNMPLAYDAHADAHAWAMMKTFLEQAFR